MTAVAPWERLSAPSRMFGGVDLGANGAFTVLDYGNPDRPRLLWVVPIPNVMRTVNKMARKRLDYEAVLVQLKWATEELGVLLWTVENPGAGFGAGGRVLGEQIGAFNMAAHVLSLRVEWVTASSWKGKAGLSVPADKTEACLRADQLFPHDREKLRGPKGGRDDGKAEAAMIGLYGARKFGGLK
jgi:hypothetical protein